MSTTPARSGRIYLEVPFSQKDAAKDMGARWDPAVKHWYVTERSNPALARWREWDPPALAPEAVTLAVPAPAQPAPIVRASAVQPIVRAVVVARVEPDVDLPCVPSVPNPSQVAPHASGEREVLFDAPWVWLDVPAGDEPRAISLGARYDFGADTFYVRDAGSEAVRLWPGVQQLPGDLAEEDRTFGRSLYPDLGISAAGRRTDAFDYLGPLDAARLRFAVTIRVRACELCHTHVGRRSDGSEITLTAWGRWRYDEATRTRTLVSLIATCRMCELTSRDSLRNSKGEPSASRVLRVEQLTGMQADQIVALWDGCEVTREQRAVEQWSTDVSLLVANGLPIHEPITAAPASTVNEGDGADRYWISVPSHEHYLAHRLGATYAPTYDAFWVLYPSHPAAQRWPVSAPLPALVPGEDQQFGKGESWWELGVDDFGLSILELLTPVDAVRVRAHMKSRGVECEMCGAVPDGPERLTLKVCGRWSYDDETRTRTLRRLQWLCGRCVSDLSKSPLTPTGLAAKVAKERAQRLGIDVSVLISTYAERDRVMHMRRRPERWTYDLGFLAAYARLAAEPRVRAARPADAKPTPDATSAPTLPPMSAPVLPAPEATPVQSSAPPPMVPQQWTDHAQIPALDAQSASAVQHTYVLAGPLARGQQQSERVPTVAPVPFAPAGPPANLIRPDATTTAPEKKRRMFGLGR